MTRHPSWSWWGKDQMVVTDIEYGWKKMLLNSIEQASNWSQVIQLTIECFSKRNESFFIFSSLAVAMPENRFRKLHSFTVLLHNNISSEIFFAILITFKLDIEVMELNWHISHSVVGDTFNEDSLTYLNGDHRVGSVENNHRHEVVNDGQVDVVDLPPVLVRVHWPTLNHSAWAS